MVDMNPDNWLKLGSFLLSSAIYLAVFFSLGLLISCLTHRSSTSLVISLFVWTILVFLIPNLGNILARQLVQIPTVQQLELKREQIQIKTELEVHRPQTGSERTECLKRADSEREMLTEDYRNRFNRLVKVSQNITRISPAAAFTFLATDIWLRWHSQQCVLSKAPVPSALLKTRRIVVKYSHDGWTNRREQVTLVSVGFLFPELPS